MENQNNSKEFEIKCPYCNEYIIIEQVNCAIFRHGIYKSNYIQINPHALKNECEELINNNLIYGCGKPFRIEYNTDTKKWIAIECEYI